MSKRYLLSALLLILFISFSNLSRFQSNKFQGKAFAFFDSIFSYDPGEEEVLLVENCLYPVGVINEEEIKKEDSLAKGLIYFPKKEETLEDIAKKYNLSPKEILEANKLKDSSGISNLEFLVLPGVKEKKARKISPAAGIRKIVYIGGYPYGYCTSYVAEKRRDLPSHLGNAKDWLQNAKILNFSVCDGNQCQPKEGAVVSLKGTHALGHVAFVEKVEGDTILISEMNYKGWGKVTKRRLNINDPSIKGYIY